MDNKRLLIIGLVWPEPTSSAAGTRMVQLINLFLNRGYEITFASAASKSDFSYDFGSTNVVEQEIKLNDSSFNIFLKKLNPAIVMFDRFMVEEQYGWRVQQECPSAIRILDTEDLHFLRNARQQQIKKETTIDLFSDIAKREIAAILRCDISLIISETEMKILKERFNVADELLYYLPFLENEITSAHTASWIPFNQRADFIFIGNFLHEPNWHTVQTLKTKIWPMLRKKLPSANLNIYGAYASEKVMQLHNKADKFLIKGRAENAQQVISNHKVLIAPIQFGAGVKGKFIDAMHVGTPTVTTSVGAEAMRDNLAWNGFIADDWNDFIDKSVNLYQDGFAWHTAQQNGVKIINERYSSSRFVDAFMLKVGQLDLEKHRQNNFMGQMLNHHTLQSTKYMSLWIEEKNRK